MCDSDLFRKVRLDLARPACTPTRRVYANSGSTTEAQQASKALSQIEIRHKTTSAQSVVCLQQEGSASAFTRGSDAQARRRGRSRRPPTFPDLRKHPAPRSPQHANRKDHALSMTRKSRPRRRLGWRSNSSPLRSEAWLSLTSAQKMARRQAHAKPPQPTTRGPSLVSAVQEPQHRSCPCSPGRRLSAEIHNRSETRPNNM